MSAVTPALGRLERRDVLRLGMVAAGGAAVLTAAPDVLPLVGRLLPAATGSAAVVHPAARWAPLVGQPLRARLADGTRATVTLQDVRTAPDDPLLDSGAAYSLLLEGAALPTAPALTVLLSHADLTPTSLVIIPVTAGGSWEAVVDTRSPTTSTR